MGKVPIRWEGRNVNNLGLGAGYALPLILAISAINKSRALPIFREQLANFQLLPYPSTKFLAPLVVALEWVLSFLLVLPATQMIGALGSVGLLSTFTTVMLIAFWRHQRISCGCFGGKGRLDEIGLHSLTRGALLTLLAVLAISDTDGGSPINAVILGSLLLVLVFLASELVRLYAELQPFSKAGTFFAADRYPSLGEEVA